MNGRTATLLDSGAHQMHSVGAHQLGTQKALPLCRQGLDNSTQEAAPYRQASRRFRPYKGASIMASFKIDLSSAVVFVAVEPKLKVINKETGEIAIDRETKAKMMTVGLTVADEGEANLYNVSIPETGIPAGLTLGMPIQVVGLKARDWENTFNGEKRFGIAFRAVALVTPSGAKA